MFYKRSSQILFSKAIGDVEYRNFAERDDCIISWQENWGLCCFRKSIVSTILNGLFSPMLSATHSNGVAFSRFKNCFAIQYALIALSKLLLLATFQKLLCYPIDYISKKKISIQYALIIFQKLLCCPICSYRIIKCRIRTVR